MPTDQNPKQLIVERIKNASNILVTVSKNPSVDELTAALGLTLFLDKIDKVATAVFSGQIPPAIEFLEPGKMFDENVDGLRDFIIALDKSKADRLRYKVEDDVVRVFITPYKTTISEKDLAFSQGDFNVDLVIALGVDKREDLDAAITAHGRILHDATTVCINQLPGSGSLGEVDWSDPSASCLSEMLIGLMEALQAGTMDQQIASALLTGLVSSTDRFRNNHTSPKVMTIAAQLMAAGANQQLIADKLEEAEGLSTGKLNGISDSVQVTTAPEPLKHSDGEMKIGHEGGDDTQPQPAETTPPADDVPTPPVADEVPQPTEEVPTPAEQSAALPSVLPPLPQQEHAKSSSWRDAPIPAVGGTLNATTEAAEEAARHEEQDERNHVLLSHGSGSGAAADISTSGLVNPPVLNASTLSSDEPEVRDIFDTSPDVPFTTPTPELHTATVSGINFEETPIPAVIPTPPSSNATLADLEAEVRRQAEGVSYQDKAAANPVAGVDDARAAVDAAFSDEPGNERPISFNAQSFGEITHHDQNASMQVLSPTPIPAPPALPPLPDFSTLPPLPGELPQQQVSPTVPNFGLPEHNPAPTTSVSGIPVADDPNQFKLPGQ